MRHATPTQSILRICFMIALWATIAYGFAGAFRNALSAVDIHATWGPFAARVFMAPFVLSGMQLMWWFTVYRPYGLEGRPIMVMMGIVFLLALLVMWLNQEMHDMRPGVFNYLFFSYAAVAHLGYGLFGRR